MEACNHDQGDSPWDTDAARRGQPRVTRPGGCLQPLQERSGRVREEGEASGEGQPGALSLSVAGPGTICAANSCLPPKLYAQKESIDLEDPPCNRQTCPRCNYATIPSRSDEKCEMSLCWARSRNFHTVTTSPITRKGKRALTLYMSGAYRCDPCMHGAFKSRTRYS